MFQAEGREFANILRSLEQFIQTVIGQNIIHLFLEISNVSSIRTLIIQIGKILGFRNIQEKLVNLIITNKVFSLLLHKNDQNFFRKSSILED